MSDNTCYITIANETESIFTKHEENINPEAYWGIIPPHTIMHGQTSQEFHLKGKSGEGGIKGSITYKLERRDIDESEPLLIRFNFESPVGANASKLSVDYDACNAVLLKHGGFFLSNQKNISGDSPLKVEYRIKQAKIYISRLLIAKESVNIPIRKDGKTDSSSAGFDVWNSYDAAEPQPVSIDLTSTKTKLYLATCVEGDFYDDVIFEIAGKFTERPELTLEGVLTRIINGAFDTIYLNGYSNTVPWGVEDTIEWTINPKGQSEGLVTKTPIVLYAVTPKDLMPEFFKSEIPYEFLKIIVLPTIKLKIENYIEYIVRVCHRSAMDSVAVEKLKDYGKPIHSYRYENKNGKPSFGCYQYGGTYNLDAWIKNRDGKGTIRTVNCYDQAGIVIIAGCLGLSSQYHYFLWTYMGRYGFIAPTDLVGWGMTNNPFFGDHAANSGKDKATRIPGGPAEIGDLDPRRWGFLNHAFVTWKTEINDQTDHKILDACAGPHAGNQSKAEYVADAIQPKRSKFEGSYYIKTGVVDDIYQCRDHGITGLGGHIQSVSTDIWKDADQTKKDLEDLSRMAHVEGKPKKSRIYPNFPDLFQSLTTETRRIPDVTILPNGTISKWQVLTPGDGSVPAEYITADIQVLNSHEEAVTAFKHFFMTLSRPHDTAFEKPSEKTVKLGNYHLVATMDTGMIVWVNGNIFIKVTKSAENGNTDSQLESIAQKIEEHLENSVTEPAERHNLGNVIPEASRRSIRVGDEFSITVKATNAGKIEARLDNKNVLLLDTEPKKEGDYEWVFRYRAVRVGHDIATFVCSHEETYEVGIGKLDISVAE